MDTVVPAGCPFTHRELRIIDLISSGLTYKQIALEFKRSTSTVRTHIHNMLKKVGAVNKAQLVDLCHKHGWLGHERDLSDREAVLVEREEACDEWPVVTAAQKAYLDQFDRWLLAPAGSRAEARARVSMKYMLGGMYLEKGLVIPEKTRL